MSWFISDARLSEVFVGYDSPGVVFSLVPEELFVDVIKVAARDVECFGLFVTDGE